MSNTVTSDQAENNHYNPQAIEAAQQAKWATDKRFEVSNEPSDKPSRYAVNVSVPKRQAAYGARA